MPKRISSAGLIQSASVLGWHSAAEKQEFDKAWTRIFGYNAKDPDWATVDPDSSLARWWLRVIQEDHERRGSGGWEELGAEFQVFGAYPRPMTALERPGKKTLRPLIVEMRALAEKVTAEEIISVTLDRLQFGTTVPRVGLPPGVAPSWELETFALDHRSVVVYRILHLLPKLGTRIRQCKAEGCNTIFLAARRDQQFHDANCFARDTMRQKRGTPPERYGKQGRPKGKPRKGRG